MTKRIRLVSIVLAVAAALVPARAEAGLAGWCDGNFTGGSGVCPFVYAGHAFGLYGEAFAAAAPSVFVEIVEPTTGHRFAYCYAHATGTRAFCDAASGAIIDPQFAMPAGLVLHCRVTGNASGRYGCISQTF